MKTPQQWLDEHGYDRGVCCGHGDYETLPRRLTLELIARIQADARKEEPKPELKRYPPCDW